MGAVVRVFAGPVEPCKGGAVSAESHRVGIQPDRFRGVQQPSEDHRMSGHRCSAHPALAMFDPQMELLKHDSFPGDAIVPDLVRRTSEVFVKGFAQPCV